jgi:hypothetical protein
MRSIVKLLSLLSEALAVEAAKIEPVISPGQPKESLDEVKSFIKERCARDRTAREGATTLHLAYTKWASTRRRSPMTQSRFGRCLHQLGFSSIKASTVQWAGLRVRPLHRRKK